MTTKALPHNIDAERTVLGAILVDPARALPRTSILEPDHFYRPVHGLVFAALRRLGDTADLVTLTEAMARSGDLEKAGGPTALAGLIDGVPRISNVESWARIVRQHALRRELARAAGHLYEAALDADNEPGGLIDGALGKLLELSKGASGEGWEDNVAATKAAIADAEARMMAPDGIVGLRTGMRELDKRQGGIQPGDFGLACARLGCGKSVWALQVTEAVLGQVDERVIYFSLEMSGQALTKRRLGHESGVAINNLHNAREQKERDERWGRILRAAARTAGPEFMIHTKARTVAQMRTLARQVQAEHGLALVVVDYLQIVRPARYRAKRHEEVAEVARDLKELAAELNVPVIAACQLNRDAADGRPSMDEIADSDEPGRACDWACLIHRLDVPKKKLANAAAVARDEERCRQNRGMVELIVGKHRDGWGGSTVKMRFLGHLSRFVDLEQPEEEQGLAYGSR